MENQKNTNNQSENRGEKIPTVRTFEADAADYIKQTGQSRASIVLAQSERADKNKSEFKFDEQTVDKEKVKFILTITGILLFAGIIIFLVFVFFKPLTKPAPSYVGGQPIIIIDQEKVLTFNSLLPTNGLEKITTALKENIVGVNSVLSLKLTLATEDASRTFTTAEFLNLIARFAPNKLIRSLKDTYTFGLMGFDGNQPFLIFKTDSFENSSTGMTEWERTMPEDLQPLFEKESGWSETSPAFGPGSVSGSLFGNAVISNLDARILKGTLGPTVLIYSFPDKNTLIITTNEKTFSAIVAKLRNAKLVR